MIDGDDTIRAQEKIFKITVIDELLETEASAAKGEVSMV